MNVMKSYWAQCRVSKLPSSRPGHIHTGTREHKHACKGWVSPLTTCFLALKSRRKTQNTRALVWRQVRRHAIFLLWYTIYRLVYLSIWICMYIYLHIHNELEISRSDEKSMHALIRKGSEKQIEMKYLDINRITLI